MALAQHALRFAAECVREAGHTCLRGHGSGPKHLTRLQSIGAAPITGFIFGLQHLF